MRMDLSLLLGCYTVDLDPDFGNKKGRPGISMQQLLNKLLVERFLVVFLG
jgi:hypothetical protein